MKQISSKYAKSLWNKLNNRSIIVITIVTFLFIIGAIFSTGAGSEHLVQSEKSNNTLAENENTDLHAEAIEDKSETLDTSEENASSSITTTNTPTPKPTITSNPTESIDKENTDNTGQPTVEPFNVELEEIGLLDGNSNCRQIKATSNKTITDYTYVSGNDVSGGGSPQSKTFIYGICKKPGVFDYFLTVYSSEGQKKELHEFFSSWSSASDFPSPTPTETPEHDSFSAEWDVVTKHTGEVKEIACGFDGRCLNTDEYEDVTITANLQLKSCLIKLNGYSSPDGAITSNSPGSEEGQVQDNVCTYSTNVPYTIKGAKVESIYGGTKTFGDW